MLGQLCAAPWVSQSRPAGTKPGLESGSLVTIQILCRVSQDLGNDMEVHQFKPGQAPKTLYDGNQRYLCTPGRFSDSYTGHYCQHNADALYFHLFMNVFSAGRATAAPQVSVFAPTGKDLTRTGGQTTLLCLINNFYPDQVTVSWTMDGKGVSGDQQDSQSVRAQAHAQASLLLYPAPPRSLERSKSARSSIEPEGTHHWNPSEEPVCDGGVASLSLYFHEV
uniref:Ig-like domain-containing protein n=1 Tax=Hucho hucho TaxID=62062 RepID=A0A4W5QD52_9TELE